MAYELTGIFRYRLDELSNNDIRCLYDAFAEITDENGKLVKRCGILRRLHDKEFPRYCGYLYAVRSYRLAGNARTAHAAKSEFNRRAYSYYPVCVHVMAVERFPAGKPIAVDL